LQKARNFGVPIEGYQGLNCKHLGSIRGSIERNLKRKDRNELWPKQNPEHYSLSSSSFSGKTGSVTSFAGAFNAPNVHQICQNLHKTDYQTSFYVGVWSSPAYWQINGRGTTPKRPTQAAYSCRFDNLTVHHAYFEPTVGIFPI